MLKTHVTTVLLVGDDELRLRALSHLLSGADWSILQAMQTHEALEFARMACPDVIILDGTLPDISNVEFFRRIKLSRVTALVPVIHISQGESSGFEEQPGLAVGPDIQLSHPVPAQVLTSTVRTVLRLRRAERKAAASAREWRTAFDAISDAVILLDEGGRIRRCNLACAILFGKTSAGLIGYPWLDLMRDMNADLAGLPSPSDVHSVQSGYSREFSSEERWYRLSLDPVTAEFSDSHQSACAVCVLSDITASKNYEEALRRSEEQLRLAVEATQLGTLEMDLQSNRHTASARLKTMFGLSPDAKLQIEELSARVHPEDAPHAFAAIQRAMDPNGTGEYATDYRVVWPNGSIHWLQVRGRVLFEEVEGAGRRPLRLIGTFLDTTERKRTEEQIRRINRELAVARDEALRASQAKSAFLASMSHELRTPLNAIIGYAEMLHEDAVENHQSELASDLHKIVTAAGHLLELISGILDLSKIEAGKMTLNVSRFEVRGLIEGVVEPARALAVKNRNRFGLDISSDLGTMQSDETKIRQVLLNLLSNAAKFTEDGDIWLRAAREPGEAMDVLVFCVCDTGIGIPSEELPNLFSSFHQIPTSSRKSTPGTGLGLALSRQLCHMLGGEISVESVYGQGSTFCVRIPAELPASGHLSTVAGLHL